MEGSIPNYFRVEPAEAAIVLAEGEYLTVPFELVPVPRRIRFTGGGEVGN